MSLSSLKLQSTLDTFQQCLSEEEVDKFKSVTVDGVRTIVATIQARQESERNMMDMTRLQLFLDRMNELADVFRVLPDSTHLMAFVWGPLRTIMSSASQIPKALDTVLDAYEQLSRKIPDMGDANVMLDLYPDLWRVIEVVYEEIIDFQRFLLSCCNNPNMRILFRPTWNAFKPRLQAMLGNLERHGKFFTNIKSTGNVHLVIQNHYGNNYESVVVNDGLAHLGNAYAEPEDAKAARLQICTSLTLLDQNLAEAKLLIDRQQRQWFEERKIKIQEWIAGPDVFSRHKEAYGIHCDYPQTGQWVLKFHPVMAWMSDDLPRNPILWIHGIPGAGKTVLASVIINACEALCDETADSHIAYYYCSYESQELNKETSILTSLLAQAIRWRPDLIPYFDDQRQNGGELTIQKERTAERLMELVCRGRERVYLVVDGVDESDTAERRTTLAFLTDLVQKIDRERPGSLRLLVLSQDEPDIKRALTTAAEIEIQQSLNGDDIKSFVTQLAEQIGSKFELEKNDVQSLQEMVCWHASGSSSLKAILTSINVGSPIPLRQASTGEPP